MGDEQDQIERLNARVAELELKLARSLVDLNNVTRRTEDFAAQTDCWFWETEAAHKINYVSDNMESVSSGLRQSDFLDKSQLEFVASSNSGQKQQTIDAILFQKPFRNFRYTSAGPNGKLRHLVVSGWPIKNKHGEFKGFRGTTRDETEEVVERELQAEKERDYLAAIKNQSEEFKAVINNLNQSFMWFDENGNLRHKNRRVEKVHRFTTDKVDNIKTLEDYALLLAERGDLGQGDISELADLYANFMRGELRKQSTARIHLRAQQRYLRARYAALPAGGFVITHVDVTEEATTEQALEQALKLVETANHALEERVEERTQELRELQSKLIKDERDATMSKLIAKMSHELRNPLNALNTSLYVIRSKVGADPGLDNAFDRSERTIKRCVRILSDLYDYSMSAGLKMHTVDIGEWIEAQTAQLRVPDHIEFEFINDTHGIDCDIDEKILTKATWKVLHNAIQAVTTDASELATPWIHFEIIPREDRVELVVRDNGNGMPAETAKRALEPLYSTRGFGVGLGLPFAEQSFRQHGGGLHLETDEGNGTTVILWLPRSMPGQSSTGNSEKHAA